MTHRIAGVLAMLLGAVPGVVCTQTVNCDAIPKGPDRTDCYIGLSRSYQAQSDLAAARARVQSDAARYRQITGEDLPTHRPRRRH